MGRIELCEETLDVFLTKYDSVSDKYSIDKDSFCYQDAWEYESVSLPVNYNKKDTASFIESMCMVYGCDELTANKALWRCKTIGDKILNQFIHIDGISELFNEHYVEFEWDMHSRMNFDAHEISYYRDHFFHQMRNCLMLNKLLSETDVFNKTKTILLNEDTSKVSRYFAETMKKLTYCIRGKSRLKEILEKIALEKTFEKVIDENIKVCSAESTQIVKRGILSILYAYFSFSDFSGQPEFKEISTDLLKKNNNITVTQELNEAITKLNNLLSQKDEGISKWQQLAVKLSETFDDVVIDFYSKYIIESSAYIAALFHDIGYPVSHYFVIQKRLLGFSPPIYMLINGDKSSYDKIVAKLSKSLLFQLVDKSDILRRCESGDHGVISSIIFLLHFYESGLIFSLPIEQKASIEIAALAIYNHTNKYESILGEDKHAECHYQRAIFKLNPISFLLRLCDDAQEWNRTYFEISNAASLLYCAKCHTPLIRVKGKTINDINSRNINSNGTASKRIDDDCSLYMCRCGENGNLSNAYLKNKKTDFKRRIIYNVNTCTSLTLDIDESKITFDFGYDYFRLLRMCSLGSSYAFQRVKELNYIKRLVLGQDIGKNVRIKFIMSNNPIFLKSYICKNYIDNHKIDFNAKDILFDLGLNDVDPNLMNKWEKQLEFYYNLAICSNSSKDIVDELLASISNDNEKKLIIKMTEDAIERYKDLALENDSSNDYLDKYMKSKKSLKFDIDTYCDPENEINCNPYRSSDEFFPDYYSDLYIFELLNDKLNQEI